jgi:hypothetical protein
METTLTPRLVLSSLLIFGLLCVAASCSDDDDDPAEGGTTPEVTDEASAGQTPTNQATSEPQSSTVDVTLVEYEVQAEPVAIPPGSVTFNIENIGGSTHEFVIIQSDLSAEALPLTADGAVDEAAPGLLVLAQQEEIAAGATATLPVEMVTDAYILICNTVEDTGISHFEQGMALAFQVTG